MLAASNLFLLVTCVSGAQDQAPLLAQLIQRLKKCTARVVTSLFTMCSTTSSATSDRAVTGDLLFVNSCRFVISFQRVACPTSVLELARGLSLLIHVYCCVGTLTDHSGCTANSETRGESSYRSPPSPALKGVKGKPEPRRARSASIWVRWSTAFA